MSVQFVEPTEAPETANILLYGPPGTGKTVAATSAPGPVLVLNAEGPNALRFARRQHGNDHIHEVKFLDGSTLGAIYNYLRSDESDERTVILDSVGEIYEGLVEELVGSGRATLQNYGDVNTKLDRFIRSLRDLGVNVVLVAHEQIDDSDGSPTRRPATGGKKLPERVMAQMDVVAYCGVQRGGDDGDELRFMGQLVDGGGRRAKDRSGALGIGRELNLTEWIAAYTAGLRAETNGNGNTKTKEKS